MNFRVINSSEFPKNLYKIKDSPKELYVAGDYNVDKFNSAISIVGSRNMTPYGERVVNTFINELSGFDTTIVSGFSKGVDMTVHACCLNNRLPTVVVLPFGFNHIKADKQSLVNKIIHNGGLILSEYDPRFEPKKWTFVQRNRIIAALSHATIVVEATTDSGTLHTAAYCRKYGRALFSVPGSIFNDKSSGTNQLLMEGATVATSALSVANTLNFALKNFCNYALPNSRGIEYPFEQKLIDYIKSQPMTNESLCLFTGLSIEELNKALIILEINGRVKCREGYYYVA